MTFIFTPDASLTMCRFHSLFAISYFIQIRHFHYLLCMKQIYIYLFDIEVIFFIIAVY